MISLNNIHPPKNWQDFEMLCLKLWGDIWNVADEIEFNSDNAQGQQGVDIYAPVEGGLKYNGIQCKNKKLNLIDGSPNRISITDIQQEIDKALLFKPALNKLVIATSLQKSQQVEEFVRIKSVENVASGLFSIQICFWDFFERKLIEFQKVYDWYLKNENFHRIGSAKVVFSGGSNEALYRPKFQQTTDKYILKKPAAEIEINSTLFSSSRNLENLLLDMQNRQSLLLNNSLSLAVQRYDWHQNFWFKVAIVNDGKRVIEDFKLLLEFEGDFLKVGSESPPSALVSTKFRTDIHEYSNSDKSLYIKPFEKSIVQNDSYTSRSIYLKPKLAIKSDVVINWKLLARDFEDEGTLHLKIRPLYLLAHNKYEVDELENEKTEVNYSLIKRPGNRGILDQQIHFSDNISNYKFIELENFS